MSPLAPPRWSTQRTCAAVGVTKMLGRSLSLEPGTAVVSYAGAGWSASGDFDGPSDWWSYLDQFAQRLASPVRVTLLRDGRAVPAPR